MDIEVKSIKIPTNSDFEGMRVAGRLAAETLDYISDFIEPGVSTGKIDQICAEYIADRGAISAPLIIVDTPNQFVFLSIMWFATVFPAKKFCWMGMS